MSRNLDTLIQGYELLDSTILERAQDNALKILALLLIIKSAARFNIGEIQTLAVSSETQSKIFEVVRACSGDLSLLQLERTVERFNNQIHTQSTE